MTDDFLPASEEPVPDYKERREAARAEVARRDAEEGEYWIDIAGNIWHVSEMNSHHIEKCLDMLWRKAIAEANYETTGESLNALAAAFGALGMVNGEAAIDLISDEIDREFRTPSAQELWEYIPFVERALLILKARDYVYTEPWLREVPF